MPFGVDDALMLAPYALSLFGAGKQQVDWKGLQDWLATQRPEGYLTPGDMAAGEATRARLSSRANETGANLRTEALRRARARGTDTAPAMEATLGRIGQTEARMRQDAGDKAEEQLYNTSLGNRKFEQEKTLMLARGKMGGALQDRSLANGQQSSMFNSLLDITPSILDHIDRAHGAVGGGGTRRRFNEATGGFEDVPMGRSQDMIDSGDSSGGGDSMDFG